MSTPPPAPGLAERFAAIPRDIAAQSAENRLAGIMVSLILTLLTKLFARLAELIGRIQAGEYRPRPANPRQARSAPRAGHRRRNSGQFFWPGAPIPVADEPSLQPGTPGKPDSVPIPPASTRRPGQTARRPIPARARVYPPPLHRQKRHHKPAPWHAQFVPL